MDRIQYIRARSKELNLQGHELLDRFTDDELKRICNGIGPGYFPEKLRGKISKLMPRLTLSADIHDVRFHIGGSYGDFIRANAELAHNARICAIANYPWWHPYRYLGIRAGRIMEKLCNQFGILAWNGKPAV